jgi:hypothetical protein
MSNANGHAAAASAARRSVAAANPNAPPTEASGPPTTAGTHPTPAKTARASGTCRGVNHTSASVWSV